MSQLAWTVGYGRISLKPRTESGRHTTELRGAWCLKPYWGKPDVRNFREDGWKRDQGSRTEGQGESLGMATGPYRARASVLPDSERAVRLPLDGISELIGSRLMRCSTIPTVFEMTPRPWVNSKVSIDSTNYLVRIWEPMDEFVRLIDRRSRLAEPEVLF